MSWSDWGSYSTALGKVAGFFGTVPTPDEKYKQTQLEIEKLKLEKDLKETEIRLVQEESRRIQKENKRLQEETKKIEAESVKAEKETEKLKSKIKLVEEQRALELTNAEIRERRSESKKLSGTRELKQLKAANGIKLLDGIQYYPENGQGLGKGLLTGAFSRTATALNHNFICQDHFHTDFLPNEVIINLPKLVETGASKSELRLSRAPSDNENGKN